MNRSVVEAGGSLLVVSQFTLLGDCRAGRRPGFSGAAPPEEGRRLLRFAFCKRRETLEAAAERLAPLRQDLRPSPDSLRMKPATPAFTKSTISSGASSRRVENWSEPAGEQLPQVDVVFRRDTRETRTRKWRWFADRL